MEFWGGLDETKKNIFHKTAHTFFPLSCFTHTYMLQLNKLMTSTLYLSSLWEGMPDISPEHSGNSDITIPLDWGEFLLYKQTLFQQRDTSHWYFNLHTKSQLSGLLAPKHKVQRLEQCGQANLEASLLCP